MHGGMSYDPIQGEGHRGLKHTNFEGHVMLNEDEFQKSV